jgi:hypothetical protein
MKRLSSYLIDNEIFFEHVLPRYNVPLDKIDILNEENEEMFLFKPYFIFFKNLNKEVRKAFELFYVTYAQKNNLQTSVDIEEMDILERLCFVYTMQFYFL